MDETPITFTIQGGYTPDTIPMERLGEYMAALARMLGEEAHVHFDRVVEGSVALLANVDEPAQPKVRERVRLALVGDAPAEVRKHYDTLDNMLRRDNSYGALDARAGVVLAFPGRNRPEPVALGPFKQQGSIDGRVYRIGGKDPSKHVHIHSGDADLSMLYTNEAVARRLRDHLFEGQLRFRGEGSWLRHGDGRWELKSFRIDDFEPLDDASLIETVAKLRGVTGDEFGEDPLAELLEERRDADEAA